MTYYYYYRHRYSTTTTTSIESDNCMGVYVTGHSINTTAK